MPPENEQPEANPPEEKAPPFRPNYEACAVAGELHLKLRALLDRARAELNPRNFLEDHLVDQLVVYKWRLLRVLAMESSVYQHEHATFRPPAGKTNPDREPNSDLYWLALSHSPERQGHVLAALARLEARYQRQFSSTLHLFLAIRRQPDLNNENPTPAAI